MEHFSGRLSECHVGNNDRGYGRRPSRTHGPARNALDAHGQWQVGIAGAESVSTGTVLDTRLNRSDSGYVLRVLHLGETVAEILDEHLTKPDVIGGIEYIIKYYRISKVPVISTISVGQGLPYLTIETMPVHRHATPTSEVLGLRDLLEDNLHMQFPPLGGIAEGIRNLWGTTVKPRLYNVQDPDSTRVMVKCAPGAENQQSTDIESQLQQWPFLKGNLMFTDLPFRVDAGKAIFSFGAKVNRGQAYNVIQSILAAA